MRISAGTGGTVREFVMANPMRTGMEIWVGVKSNCTNATLTKPAMSADRVAMLLTYSACSSCQAKHLRPRHCSDGHCEQIVAER